MFLVENLPGRLWRAAIPGAPRRTIRMLAAHIHNARCSWVERLGRAHGIVPPASVDRHTIESRRLVAALERSSAAIAELLLLGCERDGRIPDSDSYVWRNLQLDVGHFLTYFAAHEGHHRGQIVLAARQLGHRLPSSVTGGLWQWSKREKETKIAPGRRRSTA
ncbi:MAG TPA: DinB family protein [Thermoanaerobaculia bacterium]|nr:DinB family protein [Thermoanaerobaculia bacterium]